MLEMRGKHMLNLEPFSDMSKESQSPTKAEKKQKLESIIKRITKAEEKKKIESIVKNIILTKHEGKSTKYVKILDNDVNIEGIQELVNFFKDSNSVPRTVRKMLTSKDAKVLDSNACNKKYPTTISHTRASKTRPCYIYLKGLNIRLMKPK